MEGPIADSRIPYRTLREVVQRALRDDILHNRFRPGQRLTEGELATAYGVSRAPVREAVRALEEQGLLRAVSNRGVVVSRLSPQEIREVYEMRMELEALAVRLAVPNLQQETLELLRGLVEAMNSQLDRPGEWLESNNRFHMALYEPSGRSRLCHLISELINIVEPHARLFLEVPGMLLETHQDHYDILAAAEARDASGCASLMRKHLEEGAELIIRVAEQQEDG